MAKECQYRLFAHGDHDSSGFSLYEVLIALLLLTSISLAVLKQQWKTQQILSLFLTHIFQQQELQNQSELSSKYGFLYHDFIQ